MIVGVGRYLPPGQERRRTGEDLVQRGAAKQLQKVQLAVQRGFQHRPGILPGGHPQAEGLVFQHNVQQHLRPVCTAGEQFRLKGGYRARQGVLVRRQRSTQRAERLGREQPAKHHKPVQTS